MISISHGPVVRGKDKREALNELDLVEISPLVKQAAGDFRPVAASYAAKPLAAQSRQAIKFVDDLTGYKVCSGGGRESFSHKAVDDRQNPGRPLIEQPTRHEVHALNVVGSVGFRAPLRYRQARLRFGDRVRIESSSSA